MLAIIALLAALGLVSCGLFEGAVYKRSVFARISGPTTMCVGESALFEVTLVYSDGSSDLVTPSRFGAVVWDSSNRATAEVESSSGLVRALAPGTTTITATPSVTTTGSGTRTAGTQFLTVTD
jgi:hypothetical protein